MTSAIDVSLRRAGRDAVQVRPRRVHRDIVSADIGALEAGSSYCTGRVCLDSTALTR